MRATYTQVYTVHGLEYTDVHYKLAAVTYNLPVYWVTLTFDLAFR